MDVLERAIELGAAALIAPEPAPMCVGDVLYDHDWTPTEAARAVLEAVDYRGAVGALEGLKQLFEDYEGGMIRLTRESEAWRLVARGLADAGGQ